MAKNKSSIKAGDVYASRAHAALKQRGLNALEQMADDKTSITVNGETFNLTAEQLTDAARRVQKIGTGGVETTKLRSYIDRIERLEEEKAGLAADVRDLFAEAKSGGFDVKTMRAVLKLRKQRVDERTEQEYMLDLYKRALGLQIEMDV